MAVQQHAARADLKDANPKIYPLMQQFGAYLETSSIDANLRHLIKIRASQINGCAFCLDMHSKDLRAIGESEQRLYTLEAWRECPWYSDRERAALAWTEALTLITNGHAPDGVYQQAKAQFNEKELSDLTLLISTINVWNRISISSRTEPGTYQPPKAAK